MAEADKVEDDEELRKKLWLMVAKHVILQEKGTKRENIRKAIAFLKETDGLLKIEDILPFFPDFALIDDFKVIYLTDFNCLRTQFLYINSIVCKCFFVTLPKNLSILPFNTHHNILLEICTHSSLCSAYFIYISMTVFTLGYKILVHI